MAIFARCVIKYSASSASQQALAPIATVTVKPSGVIVAFGSEADIFSRCVCRTFRPEEVASVLPAGLPRRPRKNDIRTRNKSASTVALCNFSIFKTAMIKSVAAPPPQKTGRRRMALPSVRNSLGTTTKLNEAKNAGKPTVLNWVKWLLVCGCP